MATTGEANDYLKLRLKEWTRPLWQPVVGRLDRLTERTAVVEARLDVIAQLEARVAELNERVKALGEDVWHSKVVYNGDRLLVGSKHLGIVYLMRADDLLIAPRFVMDGEYEPETTAFIKRTVQPDFTCIDVGANFGYYTCLMARLAWQGRVVAYEPDPEVYALLRDNVYINWCERAVWFRNAAVGAEAGSLTIYRRPTRTGNTGIIPLPTSLLAAIGEDDSPELVVDCVCLDDVAGELERVDLIKIDVEGAESLVVEGMGELVRKHRPTIIMEWSTDLAQQAGFAVDALVDRLCSLGLQPNRLLVDGSIAPLSYEDLSGQPFQNLVFTPGPA
jgi:FkbM family methyltransferase